MARPVSVIDSVMAPPPSAGKARPPLSVDAMMRNQQRELLQQAADNAIPAELYSKAKYIFRSKPGRTPRIQHTVEIRPEDMDDSRSRHLIKRWEKRHPTKEERDEIDHIYNTLGTTFAFTMIRNSKECYFETNDDIVARYIRRLIDRRIGDFANVYEERGGRSIRVGDQIFPATRLGKQTALAYAEAHGLTDLTFVEDAAE